MVSEIQVFGERNTGTNFLQKLVVANYPDIKLLDREEGFGWKHGDLGGKDCEYLEENPDELFCHDRRNYKVESNNALIIVILRNPFTWLQSMHNQPHSAPKSWFQDMNTFLHIPWESYYSLPGQPSSKDREYAEACIKEKNRFEDYPNIMKLREHKLGIQFRFKDKVKNVCYLNYEELAKDPARVLKKIAKVYGIKVNNDIKNITEDKFGDKKYKKKKYSPITLTDLMYVIDELDWSLENKAGYYLNQKRLDEIQKTQPRSNWLLPWSKPELEVDDPSKFLRYKFKIQYFVDGKEKHYA